jgi:hypothetical protein
MIFTRSSIELVSAGVNSGASRPTTRCFCFFRSGFHTVMNLLRFFRKAPIKYIQTILGISFTEKPMTFFQPHTNCQRTKFTDIII